MPNKQQFSRYVDEIMMQSDFASMRPVVEKELLQYEILSALDTEGLLSSLFFQGGTSLRLCWNGVRFSEDIDFVAGRNFDVKKLSDIKSCVEQALTKRYDIGVSVLEPHALVDNQDGRGNLVSRWQIRVNTVPSRRDLANQTIKIEVAAIDAYTQTARPLIKNYEFLPDGYENIFLLCETLEEIMADKVVALPAAFDTYIRYRDLWDLDWLIRRGVKLNMNLVDKKYLDYGIENSSTKRLNLMNALPELVNGSEFKQQMQRFLPMTVLAQTLDRPGYLDYLVGSLGELFR